MAELPGGYCVYEIVNTVNKKTYVGKSLNVKSRWIDHVKVARGGLDKYPNEFFAIHGALRKHGIENFKLEILDTFASEPEAYKYEIKWIYFLQSNNKKYGYNCNGGGLGGIAPSEETLHKLKSAANRPARLAANSAAMKLRHLNNPGFLSSVHKGNQYTKGRPLSEQHKEALSKAFTGRFVSNETKIKMSKAQSGDSHPGARLTSEVVRLIRSEFINWAGLKIDFFKNTSLKYGVSCGAIENVVYRLSWRHI
jgi:group I intron endonuclease